MPVKQYSLEDMAEILTGIFEEQERQVLRELLYVDDSELAERRAEAQALDRIKGRIFAKLNAHLTEVANGG